MVNIIGATSSTDNIFGFIDPIVAKYWNIQIWGLLLVQLLQFWNGLTLFAIITIYALVVYIRTAILIVVEYLMAFLSICVMLSLSPIFITCILFSYTRNFFTAWISLLFNYTLQPTVLLTFFFNYRSNYDNSNISSCNRLFMAKSYRS